MEEIPYNPLIIVTKDDMKVVREEFGVNDINRINEGIDTIIEWYKMQPHLHGKKIDREFLERMLILGRGSIEGTKSKIDKFCTIRGLMPEMLQNRRIEEFDSLLQISRYTPLPKLTSDHSRVVVTRFISSQIDELSMLTYFRFCFLMGDYRMTCDYNIGDTFLLDLQNVPISIVTKVNPLILKKSEIICHDCYGAKIRGIHIINAPGYIDKLVFILKQGFKEKVAKRIQVHKSYEDLQKFIPKDVLPINYGGNERSLEKLEDEWLDVIKSDEIKKILAEYDKMVSNESLRQDDRFNEEYMGMPGTFRALSVD